MELLTRNNFEDWMRKLTERLDRQDEMLLSMQPSGKAPDPMDRIRMFDNQDLCMLLQISKRTLQPVSYTHLDVYKRQPIYQCPKIGLQPFYECLTY